MSWVRNNGLTLALLTLFGISIVGQASAGWLAAAEEAGRHGAAGQVLGAYLGSGEFLSALFENWESEFLQMAVYVVLTAHLFQRGSAESRDPSEPAAPKLHGDWIKKLYGHSLGLALFVLFVASFVMHARHSARHAAEQAERHGESAPGIFEHLRGAQFWFESFQNWQSEFMSTAVLVVLSIFLREHGSPESKPVEAPNAKTGAN